MDFAGGETRREKSGEEGCSRPRATVGENRIYTCPAYFYILVKFQNVKLCQHAERG